jgi:hypothetical protein
MTTRMVRSLQLADSRPFLPRRRPQRTPHLNDYDRRIREQQKDIDAYQEMRRNWYRDTGDPRWRPPIHVPPPHCTRLGECDEIGRRR